MKLIISLLLLFCVVSVELSAQNINGRITSSYYAFERAESETISNKYLRSYQNLLLNMNYQKFSVRTSMSLENDLLKKFDSDPRLRFFSLYLEGRNIADLFSFKLGRQSVFHSVASGSFDGLSLNVNKEYFKFSAYFGGNVPAYNKLELTDQFGKDYVAGTKLNVYPLEGLNLGIGYLQKDFKPEEYSALRLDENNNPYQVIVSRGSTQFKFMTAEVGYSLDKYFSTDLKFDYDVNFARTHKVEFFGTYSQISDLAINFYYNFREPLIRYNSYFTIFNNIENTSEIELGADYKLNKIFTFSGRYGSVNYSDETSQRVTLGVFSRYASVSYKKNFGYAGELDAVSLSSAYTFFYGLVTPSLSLNYSSYKVSTTAPKNDLMAVSAGCNVRPWRILSFDLLGQFVNNRIYKNDYRLFFKINYWFNTNLDVL